MTDIEQKALALVNEVRDERGFHPLLESFSRWSAETEALCRAIEQLEAEKAARAADRQMVSDAIEKRFNHNRPQYGCLELFIIAKPDPLVEALHGVYFSNYGPENVRLIRAAIEENGGKIVWGEG